MIGEKKKKFVIKTPKGPILSVAHMYDSEGNELVQDKDPDVKYTVLLSKKNPLPVSKHDEDEVRNPCFQIIIRDICKPDMLCKLYIEV